MLLAAYVTDVATERYWGVLAAPGGVRTGLARLKKRVGRVTGLGVSETQALSYLAIHGDRGQNDLGTDLGITSGASTALVDRLERQGIAERYAHPSDRRRVVVRLTSKGHDVLRQSHDWL